MSNISIRDLAREVYEAGFKIGERQRREERAIDLMREQQKIARARLEEAQTLFAQRSAMQAALGSGHWNLRTIPPTWVPGPWKADA